MGAGRKTETVNVSVKSQGEYLTGPTNNKVPARHLSTNDLGGVIFGCKNNTIDECLSKQLFGLPGMHMSYVRNVRPGLPLFLFNYSDRKMHGIFEAAGPGQLNIDPYAWTDDGSIKTQFPAQVCICVKRKCAPLTETEFKKVIEKNYYYNHHFYFELDHAQTKRLISLFQPVSVPVSLPVKAPVSVPVTKPANISYKNIVLSGQNPKNKSKDPNPYALLTDNRSEGSRTSASERDMRDQALDWDNWGEDKDNNNNQLGFAYGSKDELDGGFEANIKDCENNDNQLGFSNGSNLNWGFSSNQGELDGEIWHSLTEYGNKLGFPDGSSPNPGGVCSQLELDSDNWPDLEGLNGNDILHKLSELNLETEELKGLSENNEEKARLEQLGLGFCEEPSSLGYGKCYGQDELLQIIRELTTKTLQMERKQVERNQEMEMLRDLLSQSGRKIHHLETRVMDLESKLTSNQYAQPEKVIYIMGGYNGKNWLSSLDFFSPSKDRLISLKPMSCSRSYASVASVGDCIFVFGGGDGSSWYNTAECYNTRRNEWSASPRMKHARGSLAGVSIGSVIYAIGGGDGRCCFSEVEVFEPENGGRWIYNQSMLQKRFAPAATALNGVIYVVGGYDGKTYLQSAERYDPREGLWVRLANMSSKRGCLSLATMNEKLYAMGGYDGEKMVSSVEIFDPRACSWIAGHAMNSARGYTSSVTIDDTIYLIGGLKSGEQIVNTVECYNEGTGWCEPGFKSIGKRCFFSAIVM